VVAVEEMALESKEKILLQEYLSQLKNFTTAVQELESVTYAYTQI